jgi:hypothetical protein
MIQSYTRPEMLQPPRAEVAAAAAKLSGPIPLATLEKPAVPHVGPGGRHARGSRHRQPGVSRDEQRGFLRRLADPRRHADRHGHISDTYPRGAVSGADASGPVDRPTGPENARPDLWAVSERHSASPFLTMHACWPWLAPESTAKPRFVGTLFHHFIRHVYFITV